MSMRRSQKLNEEHVAHGRRTSSTQSEVTDVDAAEILQVDAEVGAAHERDKIENIT